MNTQQQSLTKTEWLGIWKLKIHAQLKLFLWKLAWDMLPTAIALDHVWMIRNKIRVHSITFLDPLKTSATIFRLSLEHLRAWKYASFTHPHRPPHNFKISAHRFQFDAAVCSDHSMAAAICINPSTNIIAAEIEILPGISDPLVAEASASLLAVNMATKLGLNDVMLEGDSSLVVTALRQEEAAIDWQSLNIISSALSVLSEIPSWSTRKISRQNNSLAQTLAQWTLINHFGDHIPSSLVSLNLDLWRH